MTTNVMATNVTATSVMTTSVMATLPIRAETIPREDVVHRLAAVGDDVPLLVVVASAGYGKTTALAQWADASRRPFGWVQLTPAHDDPVRLSDRITEALRQIPPADPALGPAPIVPLGPPPSGGRTPDHEVIDRPWAVSEPMVLVLDDFHHLRRRAALDVVRTLAETLPRGSQVVVSGRREPQMRLARMRSQGRCAVFTEGDLAFTEAETAALMDRLGLGLPPEAIRALVQRTEGWPAGICLAALSIKGKNDPARVAKAIGGNNRHIVAYLRDEVLSLQSAETARFLMRTAVLERMSAPVCDAVLGTTGSAAWLAAIRTLNLFIVPLDDNDEWYRYHRMFAEMLRSELRRREPGETERIHQRAATWFEAHGLPELAVRHATASRDTSTTALLIATYIQNLNSRGRLMQVRSWLETLDDAALAHYPPCAVAATWVWALTGEAARARHALQIAEASTFNAPMPDGSRSLESAVLRARAALAPDGLRVMRAEAERAVALEPPGSPWHTMASLLHGTALLLTGYVEEAVRAFESAVRFHTAAQRPGTAFALAQLSLMAADCGDWTSASVYVKESRQQLEAGDLHGALPGLLTYAAEARLALQAGDIPEATDKIHKALRLWREPSPHAFPWLAIQAAIVLGQILLDLGNIPAAQRMAQEAGRNLALLGGSVSLNARRQDLVASLERASTRASALDKTGLTRAEARILQLLPTHLSLSDIAEELVISRNTVKTQVTAVYRKLGAANRTQAVREAQERGLLEA